MGAASRAIEPCRVPARRNPRLNQPTLTMDTIGAVGRVAAIFTLITPSMIAKDFPIKSN